jgi:translation initiation factor 1A
MGFYRKRPQEGEFTGHVRTPRAEDKEMLGVVEGMSGASRLVVKCADAKERMIRIPGKIRRNIWVKIGDIVIIKPWEIETEKKGDLVWRYTKMQADWLRRKGILKD